ncbi:MAG TPA: class I SAM-dependent methyltransferase [Ardenticatenaceae bacterium]|jgi:demethylmenaquinone methyltransferase/2-methoxy-6-polyprenyl-1,4-benzoquinol methylase
MARQSIYNQNYVMALFDEMAETYGWVNYLSSFGFAKRWRVECVDQIRLATGMTVDDWMSGMGETWEIVLGRIHASGCLMAVDFSHEMCEHARRKSTFRKHENIVLLEQDILTNTLPDASADCIISTFGLKTFSDEQKLRLAQEMRRVLKSGGQFSLLEISVPLNPLLRPLFMFYLKYCIPLIGALFLGDPHSYRMLGVYTERFGNCATMSRILADCGFQVRYKVHFLGCATSVSGVKPTDEAGICEGAAGVYTNAL